MVESYTVTDVGRQRSRNEDSVFSESLGSGVHVLGVADGMGGHERGDVASGIAAEGVPERLEGEVSDDGDIGSVIKETVDSVNSEIRSESDSEDGMGTTLVFGVFHDGEVTVANVGDSRAYYLNDGIEQVTEDQSLVRELVEQGTITEEEAETHPQRNVVSQALGTNEEVEPDLYEGLLGDGVLLFCSDGLTEEVDDETIAEVVGSSDSLEEAGDALVERANENGGSDNISVALARQG